VTIEVEVVVAGGVGDLVASMLGDLTVERRPPMSRLVVDESKLPELLTGLTDAGVEVLSIVALATPDG
jgi:hypothetical protein